MHRFLFLLLLVPVGLCAQYEKVYDIPLPSEFDGMEPSIVIYSTPNPDYAEFEDETEEMLVWKHSTVIKATEKIKIKETGAYLLNNGTWWKRAAFKSKATKKMFGTRKLKLQAGDSIVFKENWRFGAFTDTGWNFWYVKGVNEKGEKVFGYEILETKGQFEDGTQILPYEKDLCHVSLTFKGKDEEMIASNDIRELYGRLVIKDGNVQDIQFRSDIFHQLMRKYASENHFNLEDLMRNSGGSRFSIECKGVEQEEQMYKFDTEICIGEECHEDLWYARLSEDEKHYSLECIWDWDVSEYGYDFESIQKEHPDFSVPDSIRMRLNLSFRKDFPGSRSWNTVERPKKEL